MVGPGGCPPGDAARSRPLHAPAARLGLRRHPRTGWEQRRRKSPPTSVIGHDLDSWFGLPSCGVARKACHRPPPAWRSRILAYTSPARGYLSPIVHMVTGLAARGHLVRLCTRAEAVDPLRGSDRAPRPRRLEGLLPSKARSPPVAGSLGSMWRSTSGEHPLGWDVSVHTRTRGGLRHVVWAVVCDYRGQLPKQRDDHGPMPTPPVPLDLPNFPTPPTLPGGLSGPSTKLTRTT